MIFFAINSLERCFVALMNDMPDILNARLIKAASAALQQRRNKDASAIADADPERQQRDTINSAFVWLHERYREAKHALFELLRGTHRSLASIDDAQQRQGVRVAALHSIMRLLAAEGATNAANNPTSRVHAFDVDTLRLVTDALLASPALVAHASRKASGSAIVDDDAVRVDADNDDGNVADDEAIDANVDEVKLFMIEEFCSHYVAKYDDVLYYTLQAIRLFALVVVCSRRRDFNTCRS